MNWHGVHSFADGFGWIHDDGREVWTRDIQRFLEVEPGTPITDAVLDDFHAKLEPLLAAEAVKLSAWLKEHPFQLPQNLRVPRITTDVQLPDLRQILVDNSLKEAIDGH